MNCLRLLILFWLNTTPGMGQYVDSVLSYNCKLYYHVHGNNSGTPVIILSGGPGASCLQLEGLAEKLSVNHKMVLIQQRGTGNSLPVPFDSTTITLEAALEDVRSVIGKLGSEKAILIGHSWGGRLALNFAIRYPQLVASMILIGPGLITTDPALQSVVVHNREAMMGPEVRALRNQIDLKAQHKTITRADSFAYQKILFLCNIYKNEKIDSLFPLITRGGMNFRTLGLLQRDLIKSNFDLRKQLPSLMMPVDIVCGRQDPLAFVSYEIKLLLPAARLHWIDECSHFPMFEQPDIFFKLLFKLLGERNTAR